MKFKISEKILDLATKCGSSFSCLDGKSDCLCDVEDCADGEIHFVKPGNHDFTCKYKTPFGYSFTCNCPVRKEIYNVYRA